ncbi:MAG: GGDEF domain-containing protein [Lachnospiraceae bacterium]|nr:GGDEF domain-containing protein [Lachnospiraceae bacterium]
MQYTVISNTKDALRIAQLTYYKDTDTTTNVFNKNKYEEMISKYYPSIDNLAVIFWDLNNLKTINDKYGHAMGDYAIEKLSSVLNNYANETRCIYRVGGDEFVMVLENPPEGKAESISTAVSEQLRRINDNEQIAIHSAVGFAYGKGKDIIEITKEADAQMYINKRLTKGGIM